MWRSPDGHAETIFSAKFAPHDHNMLVTASYDRMVKLWDVDKAECIDSLEVGEYSTNTLLCHSIYIVLC